MKKLTQFKITIGDDPDHEDLAAEIVFEGVCVAVISQEEGLHQAVIEFEDLPGNRPCAIDLAEFLRSIEEARAGLWKLCRNE